MSNSTQRYCPLREQWQSSPSLKLRGIVRRVNSDITMPFDPEGWNRPVSRTTQPKIQNFTAGVARSSAVSVWKNWRG